MICHLTKGRASLIKTAERVRDSTGTWGTQGGKVIDAWPQNASLVEDRDPVAYSTEGAST